MWKPSAISPYMLPRPMPEIIADASMANPKCGEWKGAGLRAPSPIARLVGQRQDFIPLEIGKDVIRRRQRVLVRGAERLVVGLDQPVIFADLVKAFADLRTLGRAGLGDRQSRQVHGVVGVGNADGGRHIRRRLDLGVFLLQRFQYASRLRAGIAGERESLDEVHLLGAGTGKLG